MEAVAEEEQPGMLNESTENAEDVEPGAELHLLT